MDWQDLPELLQERFWQRLDAIGLELGLGHLVMPPTAQDNCTKHRQC